MAKKIPEEDYDVKKHIKEYKRKCNECGKMWHSLVSRETEIQKQIRSSGLVGAGMACGSPSTSAQSIRTGQEQQNVLSKLRKCPKCGSANYKEEVIIYEKK